MKKLGFVVCSRTDSRRVPNKAFALINGLPAIEHLVSRLSKFRLPIVLAVPADQVTSYDYLITKYGVNIFTGFPDDPLRRMSKAADKLGFDAVIRITHDKLFCDPETIYKAIDIFWSKNLDYAYSTEFCDGSAFEIISTHILAQATEKFKKIEHISYCVKAISRQKMEFDIPREAQGDARFLIDFPEDLTALECIMAALGNECTLREAIAYTKKNPWVKDINRLPKLTVYTCVHNGEEYLPQCISSVLNQSTSFDYEYLIIDDHSTDKSFELACMWASEHSKVETHRNPVNMGLSSSSNVGLSRARGKYILRLDADDYFPKRDALETMVSEIETRNLDAVYPANYHGSMTQVQPPDECHHAGGAIFSTKALNHLKFTERLRNHDSLDIYLRAKEQLNIGYIARPIFFYRQHGDSMSKTNLELRERTKQELYRNAQTV